MSIDPIVLIAPPDSDSRALIPLLPKEVYVEDVIGGLPIVRFEPPGAEPIRVRLTADAARVLSIALDASVRISAITGWGTSTPGEQHPLAAVLGPAWLWLARPEAGTTVLLHRASGVWTEITVEALVCVEMAVPVADALNEAAKGPPGQVTVEVSRVDDVFSAMARRVL